MTTYEKISIPILLIFLFSGWYMYLNIPTVKSQRELRIKVWQMRQVINSQNRELKILRGEKR